MQFFNKIFYIILIFLISVLILQIFNLKYFPEDSKKYKCIENCFVLFIESPNWTCVKSCMEDK